MQRAFSYFLNKKKHIVEIKNLYNILILSVHKIILLITRLKGPVCGGWLVTPETRSRCGGSRAGSRDTGSTSVAPVRPVAAA